jgi:protein RecA
MAGKKKKSTKSKPVADKSSKGKRAQLEGLAEKINTALGVSGKVYLGSKTPKWSRRRTGIAALDYVLGGGLPRGHLVMFTGGESSFKSSAALISIAQIQEDDPEAWTVWLAGEGFDSEWAQTWGVDLSRVLVVSTTTGDTALETAITLLETGCVALMVFDSVQSLGTEREMEGGVDSESYAGAGAPQLWGRVMRRVYAATNAGCDACMIGISQVRSKIGGYSGGAPPQPEGSQIWALKHWKSIDVYFRKGEVEKVGDDERMVVKWREFKLKSVKNKTATPDKHSSFKIKYGSHGPVIDNIATFVKLGLRYELITQTGAWYEGLGVERTHGLDKFLAKLRRDPELVSACEHQLRERYSA